MQWKTCNDNMVQLSTSVLNSLSILELGALSNCCEHSSLTMHKSFQNTRERADCSPTLWHILTPVFWKRADIAYYLLLCIKKNHD